MLRRVIGGLALLVLVALVAVGVVAYWLLSGDGVRRAFETQAAAWLGQKVAIGGVSVSVVPRVAIQLSDVRVGEPARMTLANVDVSAPLRSLLQRRIDEADVAITRSRIELPLPFDFPAQNGATPPDAASNAGPTPAVRLVSVRSIRLRDVTLVSRGRALTVSADASFSAAARTAQAAAAVPTLTLSRLSATSGATALEASGVVTLEPRLDAQLRMTANRLDLDDLIALANAFSPSPSRATTTTTTRQPARIAARISAATIRAAGVDGRNFACDLQVLGNAVTLSPMNIDLLGGRYQGSLNARLSDTIAATLKARVTDLDVAQLAAFGGAAGTISGRLSGAATFAGTGTDFAGVLRAARGSGTASITNGTIEHLELVRTVVAFLGRPSADRSGTATDRFDRLDLKFALAQQIFTAEALSLHSPDADLVGQGSLAIATKALDGRADISLSEGLSQIAGTDLYRYTHEGNRIVLPATIGGTLGSPRLGIDARAAVGRGLRNELQRRLGGLLDRLNSPQ